MQIELKINNIEAAYPYPKNKDRVMVSKHGLENVLYRISLQLTGTKQTVNTPRKTLRKNS